MSVHTRKKRKEKVKLKEQEKARESLSRIISSCTALLDWTPKQLREFAQLSRKLPAMSDSTAQHVIELVHLRANSLRAATGEEFTLDNVAQEMEAIALHPRVAKSLPVFEERPFYNEVKETFGWMKPGQLLEYVQFCRMNQGKDYVQSLIKMTHWIKLAGWGTRIDIQNLRYEDIESVMDVARVQSVMDS